MQKLFKKIFDLDLNKVEEFIKKDVLDSYTQYESPLPRECFNIDINWYPTCNEIYVHLEPILDHNKKWTKYYFQGKEISLKEYFEIHFSHWHYTFQEIYGMMTGETVYVEPIGLIDDEEKDKKAYDFMYKGKHVEIYIYNDGHAKLVEYDYEKDRDILKEVPEDLMREIVSLKDELGD